MQVDTDRTNWILMLAYTAILVIGIIIAAFALAFYWSVDHIDRVEPALADYSGELSLAFMPLSEAVIEAARLAYRDENPYRESGENPFVPTTLSDAPTPSATPILLQTETLTATGTATGTSSPSPTPTASGTSTATPTLFSTLPTFTFTPKATKPSDPKPTNPPPQTSSTPKPPAPPKPSSTSDPYPYP